jgi:hypothetical protein
LLKGYDPSSVSVLSWQGAADPAYKEKLSLLFLSLWLIWP